jgi:rRNA processing protein Krr1/Pno1
MADTVVMSKSAKKRAAKAARDAAYANENQAPAPAVEEKAAAPKAAAKKAAQPAQPTPAKGDAGKAQAKPAAKKAAKAEAPLKQQQKEFVQPVDGPPVEWDDGQGDEWGTVSGGAKGKAERAARKKAREEEERKQREAEENEKMKRQLQAAKDLAGSGSGGAQSKAQEAIRKAEEALAKVAAGKADRESARAAVQEVMSKSATADSRVETTTTAAGATGSFTCDDERKIGRLIGPGGKNLNMIKEKTGVTRIDTEDKTFTCVGEADAVARAIAALKELNDKGFTTLAYESFDEVTVMASTNSFPDLIGKQGAIVRQMKEQLGVEVSFPNVPKGAPGKHPIKIAGEKDKAQKCKEVIESIIMYYHHPLTHEGLTHAELEVPGWAYSFIIGRGGSEMKHIQKNWDVKVYIPRETSENQNVVIVGAPNDVERAKKYVTSLVEKDRTTGRDKAEKADDHWGDDEVDPDLQQYMYKRK